MYTSEIVFLLNYFKDSRLFIVDDKFAFSIPEEDVIFYHKDLHWLLDKVICHYQDIECSDLFKEEDDE